MEGVPEGQWVCSACTSSNAPVPSPDSPVRKPTKALMPAAKRKEAAADDVHGRYVVQGFAVPTRGGKMRMMPFWGIVTNLGPGAGKLSYGVVWEDNTQQHMSRAGVESILQDPAVPWPTKGKSRVSFPRAWIPE